MISDPFAAVTHDMVRVPKENDLRHLELSRFTAEAFLGLFFFFFKVLP